MCVYNIIILCVYYIIVTVYRERSRPCNAYTTLQRTCLPAYTVGGV